MEPSEEQEGFKVSDLLGVFDLIMKAPTESLIVFVVLLSLGFSYLVIKMVVSVLLVNQGGDK